MCWWFGEYEPVVVGWPPTTGYVKKKGKDMTEEEIKNIALKAVKEALEQAKDTVNGDKWFMKKGCGQVYTIVSGDWPNDTRIERWEGGGANYSCFTDWDKIGNLFKTEKDAEKALAWLKAFKTLRDDAQGHKFDEDADNYFVECFTDGELRVESDDGCISQLVYFKTAELAAKSIEKHEKEWKIFYGVKED